MISVIIPIYQIEEYIAECLTSVINQTYKDIEIICVNDMTMDNSMTIVKEFAKHDKRIKIVNHEKNKGLGGARNTGIQYATGEYILFVDSDDYISPDMIEKLYNLIEKYNTMTAVCGVLRFSEDWERKYTTFHYDNQANQNLYDITVSKEIITDIWPSASNKLFNTNIIKQNNIQFLENILYEDHTFHYQYFSHVDKFAYISDPLYHYRIRNGSITTTPSPRVYEIFKILDYLHSIFSQIFSENVKEKLFIKISVRLLYERKFDVGEDTKLGKKYIKSARNYLKKYDRQSLIKYSDDFIPRTDSLLISENALFLSTFLYKIKKGIKCHLKLLKRIYPLKKLSSFKHKFNEIWYVVWNIKDAVETSNQNLLTKQEDKYKEIETINLENKKKIDEIWWLAWNIKDKLSNPTDTEYENPFLRFYATWKPTEFPEYFMGNIWYWVTNFRNYAIQNYNTLNSELDALKKGLDSISRSIIDDVWNRYTKLLPDPEYAEKKAVLLKRDIVFSETELHEQKEVMRSFNEKISKYWLPSDSVYEIPVFYYEHGLININSKLKDYIRGKDFIDAGAYIGDSSLILSKYSPKRIFSIELDPNNIEILKQVINKNAEEERTNIITVNCGIGENESSAVFYGQNSSATLSPPCEGEKNNLYNIKNKINIRPIDDIVSEYDIKPSLIKMDIEGMEYEAILGASDTIKKCRPLMIISIYHTPKDFLKIKPLIESWNLSYTFRVERHNPFDPVYETMLICEPNL